MSEGDSQVILDFHLLSAHTSPYSAMSFTLSRTTLRAASIFGSAPARAMSISQARSQHSLPDLPYAYDVRLISLAGRVVVSAAYRLVSIFIARL